MSDLDATHQEGKSYFGKKDSHDFELFATSDLSEDLPVQSQCSMDFLFRDSNRGLSYDISGWRLF